MTTPSRPFTSWAPIMGDWELGDTYSIYRGSGTASRGILLGHRSLGSGMVGTTITLSEEADSGRVLLGYDSPNSRFVTAGLGGYGEAYVIAEFDPDLGWSRLDGAGSRSNLQADRPYEVEVKLEGQRLAFNRRRHQGACLCSASAASNRPGSHVRVGPGRRDVWAGNGFGQSSPQRLL